MPANICCSEMSVSLLFPQSCFALKESTPAEFDFYHIFSSAVDDDVLHSEISVADIYMEKTIFSNKFLQKNFALCLMKSSFQLSRMMLIYSIL